MKRIFALLAMLMICTGCAATGTTGAGTDPQSLAPSQTPWYHLISRWQDGVGEKTLHSLDLPLIKNFRQRVAQEGWTDQAVVEILTATQKLTRPVMKTDNHWDTPQEFVARNFEGNCADIAIFMLATLKSLGYPYQARILAAKTMFVDHALLKVEMPDGSWQVFETTRATNPAMRLAYAPIVEFDERQIIFAQKRM